MRFKDLPERHSAFWLKAAIRRALRRPMPDSVPRSGPGVEKVDSYAVLMEFFLRKNRSILITKLVGNRAQGKLWSGTAYEKYYCFDVSELNSYRFRSLHFYRDSEQRTDWPLEFVILDYLRYHKIFYHAFRVRVGMYSLFRPVRRGKLDVLRRIYEIQLNESETGLKVTFEPIFFLDRLYGPWIWHHPKSMYYLSELHMIFEALECSGELTQDGDGNYFLTGKAVDTISQYELEERRHRIIALLNLILVFATVGLFFVALAPLLSNGALLRIWWRLMDALG